MSQVITANLDIWTSALLDKSSAARGDNGKQAAYGINKLRELILELAVRGKLVPQDPKDEPASELMQRAAEDKAEMVKEGSIRREKDFPPIAKNEIPFDLPPGWVWARINDVGHDWGQKTPDADFTYIDVSAIDNDLGVISSPSVLSASDAPSRARKVVRKGTVIYSTVRPYLKNICVLEEDYSPEPIASTAFAVLHPFQDMPGDFFAHFFRSPEFVKYVESVQAGIAYPAINDSQFYGGLVPVPPLAEQHRIVTKVDELMARCGQLEQQQTQSIERHQALVETLLGALTRVASAQELTEVWARIADHFDTLFTTEHSIDQLKQAIVQLAVMGKLVPQDRADDDVQTLLARCDRRRHEVAERDRRADAHPQPMLSAEDRWEVPETWTWRGLADLVLFVDYRGKTPVKRSTGVRLLTAKNVRKGQIDLSPEEFLSEEDYTSWMTRGFPKAGDVLFTTEAPLGNAAVVHLKERFALAQRVICFQTYGALNPAFLVLQVLCTQFQAILEKNGTGMTAKGIKGSKLKQLPIAVPPIAEQGRIVDRVYELLALCDALKTRLAEAQTTQIHLADAIVEQAVA